MRKGQSRKVFSSDASIDLAAKMSHRQISVV